MTANNRLPYSLEVDATLRLAPNFTRQKTTLKTFSLIEYAQDVWVDPGLNPDLVTGFRFAPRVNYDTTGGFASSAFFGGPKLRPYSSLADVGYLAGFVGAPEFIAATDTTSSVAHLFGFYSNPYLRREGSGVASATELFAYESWPDVLGGFDPDILGFGTVARLAHYHGTEPRFLGTAITAQYVFDATTLTTGTTRATFHSEQVDASGAWTLLAEGTAKSSHKGKFRLGDNTAPTEMLEVLGNVLLDNAGTTAELRVREPSAGGASYAGWKAGALAANVVLELPTALPGTNGHAPTWNTDGTFAGWSATGGGGGDNLRVEDGDNAGTFTAMADADFDDGGDVDFQRTAGPPDIVRGVVRPDSVALTTDTTGDYVSGVTANQGLAKTGTEGATLGLQDCAAGELLKRNAGDTQWECGTAGGTITGAFVLSGSKNCGVETATYFAHGGCNGTAGNVDFTPGFAFTVVGFVANAFDSNDDATSVLLTIVKNGAADTTFQCTSTNEANCSDTTGTLSYSSTDQLACEADDAASIGNDLAHVGCTVLYTIP